MPAQSIRQMVQSLAIVTAGGAALIVVGAVLGIMLVAAGS